MKAYRGEVNIVDCSIVEVFEEDTTDLLFLLKRSIELTAPKCEVCKTILGTGPGKMPASKEKPTWCFECAMIQDDITSEEQI